MSLQRNYYEVLGIPPGATTDQIKKKYRELARKYHPDVVQDKAFGQRVFTQINQAYHVLADPERRAQYNSTLAPHSSNGSSSNGSTNTSKMPPVASAMPPVAPQMPPVAPSEPLDPRKAQAVRDFLGEADNAIMAGKPIEARTICTKVLELDPRNVRGLEILGDALVQMGRREEAAVQYRKALQIAPSTLVQAKLNRAMQTSPSTQTVRPENSRAATRTQRPGENTDSEKSNGLLGRILGRK
jgi:curved DNA-binding protein CbpA